MTEFKVGDYVYASDWCYGMIVDLDDDGNALVEYYSAFADGSSSFLWFKLNELIHANKR